MSKRSDKRPYDVGYGRPPRETQFQPGQSGNPSGRPRRIPNTLRDVMQRVAAEQVTVADRGRLEERSKAELVITTVFNQAIKGNLAATRLVLPLLKEADAFGDRDPTPEEMIADLTPADRARIEVIRDTMDRYARDEDIEPFDADGVEDETGDEPGP